MDLKECFLERFLAKRIGQNEEWAEKLIRLSREGHLCMNLPENTSVVSHGPIIVENNWCYLQKNWEYEQKLIRQIHRLKALTPKPFHDPVQFEQTLEPLALQPEQKEAIRKAFSQSFSLICGGPGTGKTYTAAMFVRLLSASFSLCGPLFVTLAAPTGKAASHLEKTLYPIPQNVKIQSSTLHRLLKNKGRIDADLVIVDEGSMIDVHLWVRLLESIGENTRLVILGDPDQLPPVESGSLFSELAPLLGFFLRRCMRTEEAALHALSQAIRSSNGEEMVRLFSVKPGFDIHYLFQKLQLWSGLEQPDPTHMLSHYRRLGIVNALRQGPFGSEQIQKQILDLFIKQVKNSWWAIPILVTKNAPRLELYNGTFGVLVGQGRSALANLQGTAYFPSPDGGLAPYVSPPPIEPAFCISIHKSQGSEFDEVIALFPPGSERLGREALYTAVTRAKKHFEWFGDEKTLEEMVKIRSYRVSGLSRFVFGLEVAPVLFCHQHHQRVQHMR